MTEQAYPDALPPQYRLHWYVLERVLGQGGFGITYLARDTNLDQPVAIKEYLPVEVATRRPDATIRSRTDDQRERYRWGLERFIREARTLARFDHPNVVRVHSIFELNNTAYMVMRFEEGENLAARLEGRGTLTERELLQLMLPILDGLALVHQAGFIHRDIKPDNIHIRTDGTPVLLDFGSARNAVGKAHTVTILVAPGYAPFEQYYSDSESQGPWTDIYSLGATCYRAIAGRAPIDAIARSKGILGSTRDVLVPATVIGAGRYSGKLLAAIDHALAFAEKDRPQTLAEWRRELTGDGEAPSTARVATERVPTRAPTVPVDPVAPRGAVEQGAPGASNGARGRIAWSIGRWRGLIMWSIGGAALVAVAIAIAPSIYPPPAHRGLPPQVTEYPPRAHRGLPPEAAELEQQLAEEKRRAAAAEAERQRLEDERRAEAMRRAEEEARRQADLERKRLADEQARAAEAKRKAELERKQTEAPKAVKEPAPREPAPPVPPPVTAAPPPAPPTPAQQLASADRAIARGSYTDAAGILKPLADADNAAAQLKLGTLYLRGQGVAPNDQEAIRLFRRAAEQGNAGAQTALADLYAAGRGVTRDDAEARAWYQKAAAQGDGDAQTRLGDLYANGRGGPQNSFQAYVWYGVAARSGNAAARDKQARIATVLQPAEIQQADRLIESFTRPSKPQ